MITRNLDSSNNIDVDMDGMIGRQCKTLDRNLQKRNLDIEDNLISIPKCSTEKMRRKQMNETLVEGNKSSTLIRKSNPNHNTASNLRVSSMSQSMGNVKNVTIHPKVTQLSYNDYTPRYEILVLKYKSHILFLGILDAIAFLELLMSVSQLQSLIQGRRHCKVN